MSIRTFCVALAAGLLAAVSGHAQTPAAQPSTNATSPPSGIADATSSAYILGRDDVVEVALLGQPGAFGGRARVQADGTIQLSLIGKVPVADRTTAEVSEAIRDALKKGQFFTDPVVKHAWPNMPAC